MRILGAATRGQKFYEIGVEQIWEQTRAVFSLLTPTHPLPAADWINGRQQFFDPIMAVQWVNWITWM
jgi:hypothetical protein